MGFGQKLNQFLEDKLMPAAGAIANNRHLKAMRDGLMSTIPLTIVGGLVLIVSNPPVAKTAQASNFFMKMMIQWRDWAAANANTINTPYRMTMALMAVFVALAVAYNLATSYKMNGLSAGVVSTVVFLIVSGPYVDGKITATYLDAKGIFTAILIGLFTVEITRFLKSKNITIKMPDGVPPAVSSSFDALIPLIVNILVFFTISLVVQSATKMIVPQAMMKALAPAITAIDSAPAIFLVSILAQSFWFVGIHGASIVKTGVIQPFLDSNIAANAEAVVNNQAMPHIFTNPFWAYFIVLGGSGATLAVTFMFLRSRSKQLKTLGKVAILPALFNINEPIIFGAPMILNPIMAIPFIFTQGINGVLAYYITQAGLVGKTFVNVPWTTPAPLGAFLASLDWRAGVLVLALAALDAVIYYPFFKMYEKSLVKQEMLEGEDNAA